MDRRLGVDSRRRRPGTRPGDDGLITTQDCVRDGTCALPGVIAIGYPIGAGGIIGPGPGGGGGWDASYSYYEPTQTWVPQVPGEPCHTGEAFFDDPVLGAGFDQLWKASNVDAAAFGDRVEQYGWIVATSGGGYRVEPVGSGNVCGATFDPSKEPAEGYAAIVGFIHTHPYDEGELVASCGLDGRITGFLPYSSEPSEPDLDASKALGDFLAQQKGTGQTGPPLMGIVLDGNNISVFAGETVGDPIPRCGY